MSGPAKPATWSAIHASSAATSKRSLLADARWCRYWPGSGPWRRSLARRAVARKVNEAARGARFRAMARILHLSDLHFGAHDPRLVEAVEARVARGEAPTSSSSPAISPSARAPRSSRKRARSSTRLRDAGHEVLARAGQSRRAAVRRAAPLPVAADPLPPLSSTTSCARITSCATRRCWGSTPRAR